MKIIVTGHSNGIGKALFEYFLKEGHIVVGYSKSTGHDISDEKIRKEILKAVHDADIFVNNAYNNYDDSQLELLKGACELWKDTDKIILNVSTRATRFKTTPYAQSKLKVDEFCDTQLYNRPYIVNLKPGFVDTRRVADKTENKMTVDEFVDVVNVILKNWDKMKVLNITFAKSNSPVT